MNNLGYWIFPLRLSLFAMVVPLSFPLDAALPPPVAQNIYIAQNASGLGTGINASNAYGMTWLTASGNWGSGAGQVGPGVTVHLVAAIATDFAIQGSGTAGNPITIKFEPGAYLSTPCQADLGNGIIANGQKYIVIDGGGTNNGAIFCSGNGYGLANGHTTAGVSLLNCSYVTVQNLAVTNLYVPVSGQANVANGLGVWIDDNNGSGCNGIVISNCLFHDEAQGVAIQYGQNFSNILVTDCTMYNNNWNVSAGDGGFGAALYGLTVSHCWFHDWNSWNTPSGYLHHNGCYVWAVSGGMMTNVTFADNIVGPGFGGSQQTGGFYCNFNVTNLLVYNNIINASDGSYSGNAYITLGMNGEYASSIGIFNNTIIGDGAGTGIGFGISVAGITPIFQVSNNLIEGVYTAISLGYFTQQTIEEDYNLICNVPYANMLTWGNGQMGQATVAQWQASGTDAHLVQGNPNLNSSFAPQANSAAIGAGANLSSVFTTDFNGNPRPSGTTAWDIGAFQSQGTGSLEVEIFPTNAIADGAQWQLDGGPFQNSGTIVANLPVGQHVVSFNAIGTNWTTPSNLSVWINNSSLTNVSGTYMSVAPPPTNNLAIWNPGIQFFSPVAEWAFTEGSGSTASDSSGGHTGTLVNGPAWVAGESTNGFALSFNGASQYMAASGLPANLSNFSYSCWIKCGSQGASTILSYGSVGFAFYAGQLAFITDGNFKDGAASSANAADGNWHCIAGTCTGNSLAIYVDGVQTGSAIASSVPGSGNFLVGWDNGAFGLGYFPGTVGDVRVYSQALPPNAVAAIYRAVTQ
jgi:hypothetical protein